MTNQTQWKRNCPSCGKGLFYTRKGKLLLSEKEQRLCLSCIRKGALNPHFGNRCSIETKVKISSANTGRVVTEETRKKLSESHRGDKHWLYGKGHLISGKNNPFYGKLHSDKTKEKISENNKGLYSNPVNHPMFGKIHTEQTKEKMSRNHSDVNGSNNPLFGKHHSEKTKYRMRLIRIADLTKKGFLNGNNNYNPVACKFIDKMNLQFGLRLQHALNGGEVELYGYFVDGYDKEKSVIFEYDEISHSCPSNKRKDIVRQENLLREINPSLFLRYDEKKCSLYDVKTSREIPFIL